MGRTRGFWWGPDSDALLVQRVDVAPIDNWWISAPVAPWESPTQVRYPAAGSANADVDLAIVGLDGSRVDLNWRPDHSSQGAAGAPALPAADGEAAGAPALPAADGEAAGVEATWEYLADADWSGSGILLTVQSRDQRTLGVLEADVSSGVCRERYRTVDEHWVEIVSGAPALHGGRLVTVEDRGPARRLCVDGEALTGDGVQVRSVVDVGDHGVVITASREPTSVQVATVDWTGGLRWWDGSPGVKSAVSAARRKCT